MFKFKEVTTPKRYVVISFLVYFSTTVLIRYKNYFTSLPLMLK